MKYEAVKTTYELKLLIEKQYSPPALPKDAPFHSSSSSSHGGKTPNNQH